MLSRTEGKTKGEMSFTVEYRYCRNSLLVVM